MPDNTSVSTDGGLLVEHFYRQLAVDRVAHAREALAAEPVERALTHSAEAFEHAAAALGHAMTVEPGGEEIAQRLAEHAEALVLIAARFEQSADLARHVVRGHQPPR